jgi:integrase
MTSISVTQVLYKSGVKAVFKEPKTAHSRRRVAMTPKLAIYLRGHKASREWLSIQSGRTLTLDDLLFTTCQGLPLNNGVVSHAFHKLASKAGINGVRFHDLRHTFASLMLMRGAKPKVISEALGHASVAFTMDVYSHIIDGMQEDAMVLLDGVMPSGVSQSFNTKLTPSLQ